ncbi:MAG: aldo/keto reductase [Desulfocapsaceae bacterium]|nr:aldo/keto reductase [Desulfocapsaceae bacterium]
MQRRTFIGKLSCAGIAILFNPFNLSYSLQAKEAIAPILKKKIPSTREMIPVIGMGTWITFNVGKIKSLRDQRTEVLKAFLNAGGTVIDSSPMYGSSEEVLGYAINKLAAQEEVFAATKTWTSDAAEGKEQFKESQSLWGLSDFELQQVHNLVNWQDHLPFLQELKKEGKIRYLGITTSHGRRHAALARLMEQYDLDFVQFTYNLANRDVENRLLPLAREKQIAIIVNRPFGGGRLIRHLKKQPLPEWHQELACNNWPELALKYIVSHPAVTVAIPATSKLEHMRENMGAVRGRLLVEEERQRLLKYVVDL